MAGLLLPACTARREGAARPAAPDAAAGPDASARLAELAAAEPEATPTAIDPKVALPARLDALVAAPHRPGGDGPRPVALPWTYATLKVVGRDDVAANEWPCRLDSACGGVLGEPPGESIQWLAVAVRPAARPTRLVVRARGEPAQPLPGIEATLVPLEGKASMPPRRADRHGAIELPAPTGAPAVSILELAVYGRTLARRPIVPGRHRELVIELPHDALWLEAAATIAALEAELEDLCARRELCRRRAEHCAKAGATDEARRWAEQAKALPGREAFLERVAQRKQRVGTGGPPRADIDALFDELSAAAREYLDPGGE